MKPTPIHLIVSHVNKMKSLPDQIAYLQLCVDKERPYSVRRNELESLLQGKMTKQMRRENKAA